MSRSEFRWNKKRKHYAYLHKDIESKRMNILITSKPTIKNRTGKMIVKNIPLYHHPNSKKKGQFYVIPRKYLDEFNSFDMKAFKWNWHKNDKRKIKRIKKKKYVNR